MKYFLHFIKKIPMCICVGKCEFYVFRTHFLFGFCIILHKNPLKLKFANQKRLQQILNYLQERHFASIDEIAKSIYVSGATARRDLQKLAQQGYVKTVYGGVVLTEYSNEVVPISLRDKCAGIFTTNFSFYCIFFLARIITKFGLS